MQLLFFEEECLGLPHESPANHEPIHPASNWPRRKEDGDWPVYLSEIRVADDIR